MSYIEDRAVERAKKAVADAVNGFSGVPRVMVLRRIVEAVSRYAEEQGTIDEGLRNWHNTHV